MSSSFTYLETMIFSKYEREQKSLLKPRRQFEKMTEE